MSEAIGGSWLLGITVLIISIFTAYLAFSVNYSKAFKVKDGIVERIEKYDGFYGSSSEINTPIGEINTYLSKIGYNTQGKCTEKIGITGTFVAVNGSSVYKNSRDKKSTYCIERVAKEGGNGDYTSAYYKVTVFYGINLGVIDTNTMFFLTGETKNIYYPKDSTESFWKK